MEDSRSKLRAGLEVMIRGSTQIERHQRKVVAIRAVYMHGDQILHRLFSMAKGSLLSEMFHAVQ